MSEAPQEVQLSLAEFDRTQLPVEQRELTGDDFREAVREHLSAQFADQGGAAQIAVTEDRIIMRWTDDTEPKPLSHVGIEYLKAGNLEKGLGPQADAAILGNAAGGARRVRARWAS